MAVVRYTDHLKLRLKLRGIPDELPRKIYERAESKFIDSTTGHNIAIATTLYRRKKRLFLVAYDVKNDFILMVTAHPISKEQIDSRVRSERWMKVEE